MPSHAAILTLLATLAPAGPGPQAGPPAPSAASRWLDVALDAAARDARRHGGRPTVLARALSLVATAMYDAWAAYDARAVGTRLPGLRRPVAERTRANRETAIAYAAYRALRGVFPDDAGWLADQMRRMGHDPDDTTTDPTTPQGVGNTAAAAVLAFRRHDGANQLGDEPGSDGTPYGDYTFYRPVNRAGAPVIDPDCWQPIPFDDGRGGTVAPGFLTPHWYRVRPFALGRGDRFRPGPPPKIDAEQLRREVDEVLAYNAALTPEQKAIVECFRDGPGSTGPAGHWLRFAQEVSRRDGYDLDRDVKLFFAVANVAHDAFVAAWDAKRFYDSPRPWMLVRHYHAGRAVKGWVGPGRGVATIPAEAWRPYSPATFVTPPFPGYVSGHSTISAACAKALELFTGSDRFGHVERWHAGVLTEPDADFAAMQASDGVPADGGTLDVTLELPTFSAAAEMAGLSRILGGYHIQADNLAGLELGRKVALYDWPRLGAYFDGTAATEPPPRD